MGHFSHALLLMVQKSGKLTSWHGRYPIIYKVLAPSQVVGNGISAINSSSRPYFLMDYPFRIGSMKSRILRIYLDPQERILSHPPKVVWLVVSNIFLFSPLLGEMIQFDNLTNIFQIKWGWNHQLEKLFLLRRGQYPFWRFWKKYVSWCDHWILGQFLPILRWSLF